VRFLGTVTRKRIRTGSKSEHEAMVLVIPGGASYKLRRPGGNPFWDEGLAKLEGEVISGEGELEGEDLFLSTWRIEKRPEG
jgi:hypothetical protein